MHTRLIAGTAYRRSISLLLVLALASGPSVQVWAQGPQPRELGANDTILLAEPGAGKIDLQYVTPSAVALAVIRPHQLLTSPATSMLPVEVASAAGLQQLGIDPADVEEIIAFAEPPLGVTLPYGLIVKFSKPFDVNSLPERLHAHTQSGELAGKSYLASRQPMLPSFYMADGQTLLVMPENTLRQVLTPTAEPANALVEHAGALPGGNDVYAVVDMAALRPMIVPWLNVAVIRQGEAFPAEAKPLLEAPNLISAIDLAINITNRSPTLLAIHSNDAKSADRLEELYGLAKDLQRKRALEGAAKLQQSNDPIQKAFGKYIERVSNATIQPYKYDRQGDNLILFKVSSSERSLQTQLVLAAVGGILVALLLPAIQAAREAARRAESMNNLKQLMLAMMVYADSHKVLPPHASYNPDGKPLLSWRVLVLPYLEQEALYRQFHLDEPWDSPHNRTLIEKMPAVFADPNLDAPGKTHYLALVGPECVLDGSPNGIGFARISDGTSNTIVLVEADADQAVEWTKPDDLEFDAKNPKAGVGSFRPGGCNAAYCDGHIEFISGDIDPAVFKALVTRSGRETVNVHQ